MGLLWKIRENQGIICNKTTSEVPYKFPLKSYSLWNLLSHGLFSSISLKLRKTGIIWWKENNSEIPLPVETDRVTETLLLWLTKMNIFKSTCRHHSINKRLKNCQARIQWRTEDQEWESSISAFSTGNMCWFQGSIWEPHHALHNLSARSQREPGIGVM